MTHTLADGTEVTDIPGYEDRYAVSRCGRIWSFPNRSPNNTKGRWLKPESLQGYLRVHLLVNGRVTHMSIHRAVALTFIPNPYNKPQVNHKDGDKTNCNVDNLEWNTCRENIRHAFATGLRVVRHGEDAPAAKLSDDQVRQIRAHGYNMTAKQLGDRYGVHPAHISKIRTGSKRQPTT